MAAIAVRLVLVPFLLLSAALSGCSGSKDLDGRCDDVAEYQLSGSVPDVVVPDGLAAPSRDATYSVPPATGTAEAQLLARGAACLERPPDYFRKDPAAPPPQ